MCGRALFVTTVQLVIYILFWIYRTIIRACLIFYSQSIFGLVEPFSTLLVDNFSQSKHHMTLQGILDFSTPLDISELKVIFEKNILKRTIKRKNREVLRYPELTCYQRSYFWYSVWMKDSKFSLSSHIFETILPGNIDFTKKDKIHQYFLNQPFPPNTSPWSLILLQNYATKSSLLVFRMHHSMADAKSISKLLGESLSNKILRVAQPVEKDRGVFGTLAHWIRYPVDHVTVNKRIIMYCADANKHPLAATDRRKLNAQTNVGITAKLSMSDLKYAARQYGVRGSSILYAVIGSALGKFRGSLESDAGFPVGITLNRKSHPETLTNHLNGAIMLIPTSTKLSFQDRACIWNTAYNETVFTNIPACGMFHLNQLGTIIAGKGKWGTLKFHEGGMFSLPVVITNIAFDDDGFSVGEHACNEFTFSSGINCSIIGVFILAYSYKDSLQITVAANSNILTENEINYLVQLLNHEFALLTNRKLPSPVKRSF